MIEVLVDKIPIIPEEYLFAEYIHKTSKYKCMFKNGIYSRCRLEMGKECDMLKEYKVEEKNNA